MQRKKGMMLSEIPFRNMPVLLKECGFDYFIIDTEHGGFDYSVLSSLIMTAKLCDIECIIRLPDNSRREIIHVMDMGANGVLLPMTNNAKQIEKVVEYAKYFPVGKRGISTMRAHTLYNPKNLNEYMQKANQETKVFAQIETVDGLNNVKEILEVEGVNGILIGPNDMACDMSFCNGVKDKIIKEISRLSQICKEKNKVCGIITSDEDYLQASKNEGLQYFCVGSELSMLKKSALETVNRINL